MDINMKSRKEKREEGNESYQRFCVKDNKNCKKNYVMLKFGERGSGESCFQRVYSEKKNRKTNEERE